MEASTYHTPVLLQESLSFLLTTPDGIYVDCTLGGGGHAEAILHSLRGGRLIGFDRDPEAIAYSRERLSVHGHAFEAVHAPFGDIAHTLEQRAIPHVHGILLDLGVSSRHLDAGGRGFSFQQEGPLDMRMNAESGVTARDVVNTSSEADLESILRNYGEEKEARRIVRSIVRSRPLGTTVDLRAAVESAAPASERTKTLARVFQAIRIEVNEELDQLHKVLASVPSLLIPGGRVVVLSYHSLEDRVVKEFFRLRALTTERGVSKFLPPRPRVPELRVLTKRPVLAGASEISKNIRARSAKLRAAERL